MNEDRRGSVTLETKCWEGDWKTLLLTNHLQVLAEANCFPFAERVLMINNVTDYPRVQAYAQRAVEIGLISKFIIVKDHAEEALSFFRLTPESLGRGYVYSVAELVSIYLCPTEFLLHFSGDSLPDQPCNWIPQALAAFESDRRVKVANLTWNRRYQEARAESSEETADFYLGYGFSDQCYLIQPSDFRAPIYNEHHPASQRYPAYGGELFEKKVDSWMRNHGHLRATYKHAAYLHDVPR
jgi:hypothetical protein